MDRVCKHCRISQPESDYYLVRGRPAARCKACYRDRDRAREHRRSVERKGTHNDAYAQGVARVGAGFSVREAAFALGIDAEKLSRIIPKKWAVTP